MQKNKESNVWKHILKTVVRVLILNIPAVIILLGLLALDQLSWVSAGISLIIFWAISGIIVFYVFKDLDNFMIYLKKLAQGFEPDLPKLHWGLFSSMRLTRTFLSVKNLWFNQFLSDTSVMENLPNPLIMLDKEQKIVFANISARHLFSGTLLNSKIQSVCPDSYLLSAIKSVFKGLKNTQTLDEWEYQDKNDKIFTFQIKIDRLPAPTKNGALVAISFFDITPFKLFKRQQVDFFANASHELKTPLAIISASVETLQGPAKNDAAAQDKFLSLISEQSTRMTNLVQKMLQLSKMQIDVPLNKQKKFSINDLIQKVVTDFDVRAKAIHKKIVLTKQPHLPLLLANRNDLYHVCQNLLDNALKYSEPRSTISIHTYLDSTQPTCIVISIHNTGNPIPLDQQQRIWDQFYRINNAKKSIEGNGLGLGIVQQLVHKYQGRIELTSTEETGTTFSIYLPVDA